MQETKTKYYLGGYYLVKLKPTNIGTELNRLIYTCSECITDHLLDIWSYSWTTDNNKYLDEIKSNFQILDYQVDNIRKWVDTKFNDNKIGFLNVFIDLETVIEYKTKFFSHLNNTSIFALYFDNKEKNDLLNEFKPQSEKMGDIGLRLALLKETEEQETEQFLGFDYIGIEYGGSFHSFHCHNLGKELCEKYELTLNKYGLFESNNNSGKVLDYLNDEENGCESVPWFIVKTKLVTNTIEHLPPTSVLAKAGRDDGTSTIDQ